MNQPVRMPLTLQALMQMLSADCELHALAAQEKLLEVIERFRAGEPLAAIGAFEGTPEIILYIDVITKRLAGLATRSHSRSVNGNPPTTKFT
jgi:hypothetical protein